MKHCLAPISPVRYSNLCIIELYVANLRSAVKGLLIALFNRLQALWLH